MSASRKFTGYFALIISLFIGTLFFTIDRGIPIPQAAQCSIPALTSSAQYKRYISTKQAKCDNWAQLGGWFGASEDGRKLMCLDERFGIQAGKCVVLSFGVNNEWSFEDDAEKLGCKVYAFDPTMGMGDHQRTPSIQFFKLGISDVEGEKKIGMNPVATDFNFHKVRDSARSPSTATRTSSWRLGLEGRVIDYVKMDIELAELDVLRDLLDNSPRLLRNINQLAIEIHHDFQLGDFGPNSTVRKFWPFFHRLRCHGFSIMNSKVNFYWQEMVWGRDTAGNDLAE
ncbi:uncharacterized protein LOC125039565 [Penaeus chinensis]|uniref:uncharacterized protein LOC125039565 n=1 Tax=Penaeus chinensis TaxID=139456 RepID=UPI001FB7EB69|nr:uncharacterized protein LOC125039565 [Penaeus chinensis]